LYHAIQNPPRPGTARISPARLALAGGCAGLLALQSLSVSIAQVPANRPGQPFEVPLRHAPAAAYGPDVRPGQTHPNLQDLAGIAERHRQAGEPIQALHLALRVRDYAPRNVQAIQTEISSLSNLGAPVKAYDLSLRLDSDLDQATSARLRADLTAARIRSAIERRDRLQTVYRYDQRNAPLEALLPKLEANQRAFEPGSIAYQRTLRDRIVVLRELNRMHEVLALYRELQNANAAIPPYTRQAAADAYLALRQPQQATPIYTDLIEANPRPSVTLLTGAYYAAIESEQYDLAERWLVQLDHSTPVWLDTPDTTREPEPNWERVEVDQLQVLDAIYRNHHDEGTTAARKLFEKAPRNVGLINTYATALRWRGLPAHAQRQAELAAAYAPEDRQTRTNLANNARDLEQFDRWARLIEPLARTFDQDTTIQRSRAELADRDHFSVSGQASIGDSDGGDAVDGSRDRELLLRLNSPWSDNGIRAYAQEYYRWGDYEEGDARFNRPGIGVEWRWARKHAWATLSDDGFSGDEIGIRLGWSQWLNDHWQYELVADSYARETPLRAEREGLQGRLYQGSLTWRQNESRQATLEASLLDISDGNVRSGMNAALTQRIQASAHHLTRAVGSASLSHNSQPGGVYYNPEDTHSVGIALEHDWLTWRDYERSFTQNFELGATSEWETGEGAAAGFDALYGHTWELSRTWSMNYGIGWGSHEYDGEREQRTVGVLGFSGVFQ
jgi:poly-beta-1,6 N-acetyl-D-glucosamine export porin PgaA